MEIHENVRVIKKERNIACKQEKYRKIFTFYKA